MLDAVIRVISNHRFRSVRFPARPAYARALSQATSNRFPDHPSRCLAAKQYASLADQMSCVSSSRSQTACCLTLVSTEIMLNARSEPTKVIFFMMAIDSDARDCNRRPANDGIRFKRFLSITIPKEQRKLGLIART